MVWYNKLRITRRLIEQARYNKSSSGFRDDCARGAIYKKSEKTGRFFFFVRLT
jgi:hypothetical protein